MAFAPGTNTLFITEKKGTMKFVDLASGRTGTVTGVPEVAYGGQGGLGDVAFLPGEASDTLSNRTIYLTWAQKGEGDARRAVMGRGTLVCEGADACRIDGLQVIWRQQPEIASNGHFSHKIAFSPDGQHMFVSSGDRMQGDPAQDLSTNLGKVLRLNLDGTPAQGNPFADRGGVSAEIWSYGQRNLLGLQFDSEGRLWDLEHGPRGGDELNLVERGVNYGWPVVSNGDNYNGDPIPDHATRPEFRQAAIGWTPVIAPGDFIFYSGELFPNWQGDALIPGLGSMALVHVDMNGTSATEAARHDFGTRLRDIVQGPDGSVWMVEDGPEGRLLRLTPS
jgi:glucose/arabinose dehydrogenase